MKVIDLMCGMGGRTIAFKEVGYDVVYAVDREQDNEKIFREMMGERIFVCDNIFNIKVKSLPKADVILGRILKDGISSKVKSLKTEYDRVNDTIYRIIAEKKPKFFVLESSMWVLSRNSQDEVESILSRYISAGYKVLYNVFLEREYSGYPVAGKQLFFVGIREDMFYGEYNFPKPISLACSGEFIKESEYDVDAWYRKNLIEYEYNVDEGGYYYKIGKKMQRVEYVSVGRARDMYIVDKVGIRRFTHNEIASLKGYVNYDFNRCENRMKTYIRIACSTNVYIAKAIAVSLMEYANAYNVSKSVATKTEMKRTPKHEKVLFPKQRITNIHIDELKGLRNLDIPINKNLTAIMGVNGSGKSTILHALACIYEPYSEMGNNYKFSFFFTPNPDSSWKNSKLSITYYDENAQKEVVRVYKKESDRWSPRYAKRPIRDVIFVGIDTCIPEIEIEKQTSYIDYSTEAASDGLANRIIRKAAYILNKNYESLTLHKTKRKELLGVHIPNDITYSSLSMGAGEQRVLKILKLLYSVQRYSLILIDEIDLLLHVNALNKLIEVVNEIAEKRNLQVIFTTHSLEMVNLTEYVSIRYLDKLDQKTMVYNSINPDLIYEMSNRREQHMEIYVEDSLAEAIVTKVARDLNVLRNIRVIKFGAASNAFVVASSYILKSEDYSNVLIVLDGDVYVNEEDKVKAVEEVLSGTESNHDKKVASAISMVKQFALPQGVAPEKHIYDMLIEMQSDDEISRMAGRLNAVNNSHDWLNELIVRIGQSRELVLYRIMDIVSNHSRWSDYVNDIRCWLIDRREL
ncbi:MAG: DNA cytosine methyltransferase [Lachnospira sp.]|nr:DNA cytosine methyltransferase [Lachnospira sp.]